MTRAQDRHIDNLARVIRDADLRALTRRTKNALDADRRGGPNHIDGYPCSTMGGSGGNPYLTSVENAAQLRITGHERDPLHRHTRDAIAYLEQAVMSINAWAATLDRIDTLRHVGPDSGEPGCESCARHTGADGRPIWEPVIGTSRTNVAGRLTDPRWLCRWCRDYVAAVGQLPSRTDLATHHGGRNVRRPA